MASAENPRFIETLPRKGYRLIAPIVSLDVAVPSTNLVPTHSAHGPRARWIFAFAGIVAVAAGASWIIGMRNTQPTIPSTPIPWTTYRGLAMQASFSPDGNQVAFVWNGEKWTTSTFT